MTQDSSPQAAGAADTRASRLVLAGLAAIAVILVLHALAYDFVSDDAFIAARYARNAAEGYGFVYNIGERVEGYTSFLWVCVTALLGLLGIDFVTAARTLSLAGGLACLLLAFRASPLLGIGRKNGLALIAPLLMAASGSIACWSLGGLEACGYAAAVLCTLIMACGEDASLKRLAAAGAACGVLALLRPEAPLTAAAVVLWLLLEKRRKAARAAAAFLGPFILVAGAHLLWRHAYYGDWLPNTYYAKVGTSADQVARGFQYVLAFIQDNGGLFLWIAPFLLVWILPAPPFARALSLAGAILVLGVAAVGGDGLPMYRFMVPVVPIWSLLVESALAEGAAFLKDRWPAAPLKRWGVLLAALVCASAPLATFPVCSSQYTLYADQKNLEVPKWTAVGKWLAANAPRDASIACVPIGAVGYYSGLHVYDMVGLTDRHIAHMKTPLGESWAGHEKHDGPYILSKKPTYLLLGNIQVLDQKIPANHQYFCRPPWPAIRSREDDIFTPELTKNYEPRVVRLPGGAYFNFFERRTGSGGGAP